MAGGAVVHVEAPQVGVVAGGGLDVEVDLEFVLRQLDRAARGALQHHPGGDEAGPPVRPAQALLPALAVDHPRQVAGEQLLQVGAGQVRDRGHPQGAQRPHLVRVELGLGEALAQVVVVEQGGAVLLPGAVGALAVDDRGRRGLPAEGPPGEGHAERVLGVVPGEGRDRSRLLRRRLLRRRGPRGGGGQRRRQVEPGDDGVLPPGAGQFGALQPDDARPGPGRRVPGGLQQPPVVGHLERGAEPPGPAEPPAGQFVPGPRVRQRRHRERLVAGPRHLPHSVVLDQHGQVAVPGPQQRGRTTAAVAGPVAGQQRPDDEPVTLPQRPQRGRLLLRRRGAAQRPQVDVGVDAVAQDAEHLGLDRVRVVEERGRHERAGGALQPGGEGVDRLQRAGPGGVGVQDEGRLGHARARCNATAPPDRFFHSTSRQPASTMRRANARWSGHVRIDSAR